MVCPTALYVVGVALLASVRPVVWGAVTVAVAGSGVWIGREAVGVWGVGAAAMAAWVVVWVVVRVVDPPNASGPAPHGLIVPSLSSLTLNGPASVVFPMLVIV